MSEPFYVGIPARSASTRLPDKPLLEIAGKPMLQWVYERACRSGATSVAVAAGDEAVRRCAESFDAPVWLTAADHPNGTARLSELINCTDWGEEAVVVNVQADEPMLPPPLIAEVAHNLMARPQIEAATLSVPLDEEDWACPHAVKVWTDGDGYAEGFSRHPEPALRARCRRHLGLYAYRAALLRRYPQLPVSAREQEQSLEQWRLLDNQVRMHVGETQRAVPAGVDTKEDLIRARARVVIGAERP